MKEGADGKEGVYVEVNSDSRMGGGERRAKLARIKEGRMPL